MKNILFILLLLLVACNQKKSEEIIPPEEMVEILTDIFFSDAISKDGIISTFYNKTDTIDFYSWAWEDRGYTKAEYDTTIKAYGDDPAKLNKLYQDVIYKLSLMEEGFPDRGKDSVLVNEKLDLTVIDGKVPEGTKIIYPITKSGRYTVRVNVKVNVKDQSESPGIQVSLDDEKTVLQKDGNDDKFRVYLKDGRKRSYPITQVYRVKDSTNLIIDLAYTNNPESLKDANFLLYDYEIKVRY